MGSIILEFSIKELAALFGLAQSVYILVYMGFRAGRISRSILPTLFFLTLSSAFLLSAAKGHWQPLLSYYIDLEWLAWMACIPFSTLLVLQIARITKMPPFKYWAVLLILPFGYLSAGFLDDIYNGREEWLYVVGLVSGSVCLLLLWSKRDWLQGLVKRQNGRERYWIILSLVVLNVGLLTVLFLGLNQSISVADIDMVRVIIGISFVYIVSTSLFRIYPQAVFIGSNKEKEEGVLSEVDIEIALSIENLIHRDKVYQETSYGRSEMAKELNLTESHLSKVVNGYFNKTVPQLLNGLRVEEAKTLLKQTDADITVISGEAGFNSIATFNRVFKEIEGVSPTDYRESLR